MVPHTLKRAPIPVAMVATVVVAAAIVGGCAGNESSPPPLDETSLSGPAATPTEDPNAATGMPLQPDSSIVAPHPIPFQSWTKVSDKILAVRFELGSPQCYGVDPHVTEDSSSVTIGLRSGTKRDAVGKMCPMIAVFATMTIPLAAPLGNRTVHSAS